MFHDDKMKIAGFLAGSCLLTLGSLYFHSYKNMDGASYNEIKSYQEQHPYKTITYTITVDGGTEPIELKYNSRSVTLENAAQANSLVDQAEYLQRLETIDLGDAALPGNVLTALTDAFPNAQLYYNAVSMLGQAYSADTSALELDGMSSQALRYAADALVWLTQLETLTLTAAEGTVFTAEDAAVIAAAVPDTAVNMTFDLFGQEVSTAMETIAYFKADIGDEGLDVIRSIMPIMDKLTYLKLDWCGTSDEATARLRDELADRCKVVWRVFLTDEFNALTDTYKIWAQFNLYGDDVECLKYCTEVRYIDMGHSYVDNCDFVEYMPYLNTLILADSRLKSIEPLRSCKNLTYLEIFSSKVTDLSPLEDLPQLEYLNISNCKIDDISPLYGLDNLFIMNCTMANIDQKQIKAFQELHPDTKCTFNYWDSPTEFGWRHGPTPEGYRRTPRYELLRLQIGYDTKDYSRYPTGYLTEEITYESTGIVPPEERDYDVYP